MPHPSPHPLSKSVKKKEVTFTCRFHPTNWWHETGCDHMNWSIEDLERAITIANESLKMPLKELPLKLRREVNESKKAKLTVLMKKLHDKRKEFGYDTTK